MVKINIIKYKTCVETMANQLNGNEKHNPTIRFVEKILRSFVDNFKDMVCAIEESNDLSVLSIEEHGLLRCMSSRRRRKWSPLNKHSKKLKQQLRKKRRFILRTLKTTKEVEEVKETIMVVEVVEGMQKRKNIPAN